MWGVEPGDFGTLDAIESAIEEGRQEAAKKDKEEGREGDEKKEEEERRQVNVKVERGKVEDGVSSSATAAAISLPTGTVKVKKKAEIGRVQVKKEKVKEGEEGGLREDRNGRQKEGKGGLENRQRDHLGPDRKNSRSGM